MVRPKYRQPPRTRPDDNLLLDYDFSPRHGWGTYPIRGIRGDNALVWEDRPNLANQHPMLSRLSTESLGNLVTAGKSLGMQ